MQDRDGAPDLLARVRSLYPWLTPIFANWRLRRRQTEKAIKDRCDLTLENVKRSDTAKGFVLLPRRWVVERPFAWLNRSRRLAKGVEATIESSVTWLYIASIKLMARRLARF